MEMIDRDIEILVVRMEGFINSQYHIVTDDGRAVIIGRNGIYTDLRQWANELVNGMLNYEPPDVRVKVAHRLIENLDAKWSAPTPSPVSLWSGPPELDEKQVQERIRTSARVIIENGLFVWTGGFKTKDIPKSAGFRWDKNTRKWWTSDASTARRLFKYADYTARVEMGSPDVPDRIGEFVELIHIAVRRLAAVCDYAKDLDYAGYSKSDAYVGHGLAEKPSLDKHQAALGWRLVYRHRRQLGWLWTALKPLGEVNDDGF